jgi:hypothetical protein
MKKYLKIINDFFFMRTTKMKVANYSISGLIVICFILFLCPNIMFGHSFKYKNFNVYSMQPLDDNIQAVLDAAEKNLTTSEIYDQTITHNIYFCNSYKIYRFFAPSVRYTFACNFPFNNNIFIANCDVKKKLAYKEGGQFTRELNELIAHEITHTFIQKKLGYWKYRNLSTWKNEGYCEYIGYNNRDTLKGAKEFLTSNKNNVNDGGTTYHKYHLAVTFLKESGKMTFDDIIASGLTFEEVLKKIEMTEIEK